MRKRIPKLLMILASAACIFGFVSIAPEISPMLTLTPSASADPMPNGYDVTCTKSNDSQVVCTISGCPRVHEDLAGDVVHTKVNGGPQAELGKACGNTTTETVNASSNFDYAVQGCRKSTFGSDDCGAWSNYTYNAPQAQPVNCPGGSKTPTVVPPAQCEAAPKVKCPDGSPTIDAVSLDQCAAAPAKTCPPGSAATEVPFGGQCEGPKNAVVMQVTQEGLNANVAITNNSALPADCAYTATKTGGLLGPASVTRNVNVGPNSTGNITDMLWPPIGTSYRATAKCTAQYDGKSTSIGESTVNVG
jgi:hypothetical protein